MELLLGEPRLEWREGQADGPALERFHVSAALLPLRDEPGGEQPLPLPGKVRLATANAELDEKSEPGDRTVVFKLLDGAKVVASRALALQECVPVLAEGTLAWSHDLVYNKASGGREVDT